MPRARCDTGARWHPAQLAPGGTLAYAGTTRAKDRIARGNRARWRSASWRRHCLSQWRMLTRSSGLRLSPQYVEVPMLKIELDGLDYPRPEWLGLVVILGAAANMSCGGVSVDQSDHVPGRETPADDASAPCTTDECGQPPQLSAPFTCSDGSSAGPVCNRYPSGKCAWSSDACPNSSSCPHGFCGPAPPYGFCAGLGNHEVCLTDGKNGCTWQVTCFDLPPIDGGTR